MVIKFLHNNGIILHNNNKGLKLFLHNMVISSLETIFFKECATIYLNLMTRIQYSYLIYF